MTTDLSRTRDLTDFYLKMFAENMTMLRHHETQRSTSTTILCSLAVLLLGVAAIFWKQVAVLPVSIGLIMIGIVGFFLNMKLFERSAFHLKLALAYQESAEMLLERPAKEAFGALKGVESEREPIPRYVQFALDTVEGFARAGKNNKDKKQIRFIEHGRSDEEKGIRSLEDFNPAAPFPWVDPMHNKFLVIVGIHVARLDLYRIWLHIFVGFVALGMLGLVLGSLPRTSEPEERTVDCCRTAALPGA